MRALARDAGLSTWRCGRDAPRRRHRERGPGRAGRRACPPPLESALGFDSRVPSGGERRRVRGRIAPNRDRRRRTRAPRVHRRRRPRAALSGLEPVRLRPGVARHAPAAGCTTLPAGSTHQVSRGPTIWLTPRAGRSCATTTSSLPTSSSVMASPSRCSTSSSPAPGRPVYDLAQLARFFVPIDDELDQARLGWRPADRPARLRLLADAYGLDGDGRAELLSAMDDAIDQIEKAVRRSVDAGDPNATACGIGPGAASATTAGAAGGWTTTTSSPPPSSDAPAARGVHTFDLSRYMSSLCAATMTSVCSHSAAR